MDTYSFELNILHSMKLIIHDEIMEIYKNGKLVVSDKLENYILTWHKESKMLIGSKLDVLFIHLKCRSDFQISINSSNKYWKESKYFADNIAEVYFKKDIQETFLKACGYGSKQYQGMYSNSNSDNIPSDLPVSKADTNGIDGFVDKFLKIPGFYSLGTKKEIKYLYGILNENENVYAAATGYMDGNTWLIVCTNKRIIFIDKGMIYGVKHSEVLISKINSITYKNGLMAGEIHIQDGAEAKVILNVAKSSTVPFVNAVHKVIEISENRHMPVRGYQSISTADEILKFKALLDSGIITEQEFEEQKNKLLHG